MRTHWFSEDSMTANHGRESEPCVLLYFLATDARLHRVPSDLSLQVQPLMASHNAFKLWRLGLGRFSEAGSRSSVGRIFYGVELRNNFAIKDGDVFQGTVIQLVRVVKQSWEDLGKLNLGTSRPWTVVSQRKLPKHRSSDRGKKLEPQERTPPWAFSGSNTSVDDQVAYFQEPATDHHHPSPIERKPINCWVPFEPRRCGGFSFAKGPWC